MSRDPWLSVIVPVFNGERYLGAALQSVLSEVDDGTEVIVSDDGSTDRSVVIAQEYAARGSVVAIQGPGQGNWVANSNRAVERARGRLIAFLHQDDLWLPGRLETVRRVVAAQPDRSMWVGPSWFIDSAGRRVGTWNLPFSLAAGSLNAQVFLERLLVQNFIAMPAPVFRRSAFERAGGMDDSLWFTADWDLWLKLGAQDGVGLYPTATTAFRLHWQSQTMTGAAEHDSMREQMDKVRARHITRLTDSHLRKSVERAGRLSSEANSNLAALVSRRPVPWQQLLVAVSAAGIGGFRRFLRDARFLERSIARLRVGMTRGST
jgi:hypothetical protein